MCCLDCRAAFLTLDNDDEILIAATDVSDTQSSSVNIKHHFLSLYDLSATPICNELTIPSVEMHRFIGGDIDAPPPSCDDEVKCNSIKSNTTGESSSTITVIPIMRQSTKVLDEAQNYNDDEDFPSSFATGLPQVMLRKTEDSSAFPPTIPHILNLSDDLANQLLNTTRTGTDDRASNESMIGGTSAGTPLSFTFSESLAGAEHSFGVSSVTSKDEDEIIIDFEYTEKEKSERVANLENAIKGSIDSLNQAQIIPLHRRLPKPRGVPGSREMRSDTLESISNSSECGTVSPVFKFQWFNRQHRLSNPDELKRVKGLGGAVWRNNTSIDCLPYPPFRNC